jgi:hypothetical protein
MRFQQRQSTRITIIDGSRTSPQPLVGRVPCRSLSNSLYRPGRAADHWPRPAGRSASDLAQCPQAGQCLRNSASFESLPGQCSYGLASGCVELFSATAELPACVNSGRRVSSSVGGHRNLRAGGRQVGTAAVTVGERLPASYCSGSRLRIAALRLPIQSQRQVADSVRPCCVHIFAPLSRRSVGGWR